MPLQISVL